jgi:hypothetical protein
MNFETEGKNMPRCILIRYMFNRTLLFIASINFYIMDVTVIIK